MNSLVIAGIILSLGLMLISALVVGRVNYRRADTELDAWIYGLGMGLADLLKALIPFMIAWAWRARSYGAVVAGAVVFSVITAAALQSELEFASELRWVRVGERLEATDRRKRLEQDLATETQRIDQLGGQRTAAEVDGAIRAVLARAIPGGTVASVSQNCSLNRRLARDGCAEVAELQAELARATELETRTLRRRELVAELAQLGQRGLGPQDPQLETVTGILKWFRLGLSDQDVRLGLLLLVGLVLELGSGLGLFLVTTPWRLQGVTDDPAGNRDANDSRRQVMAEERMAMVEAYALARLVPASGARTNGATLFADFRDWCAKRQEVAWSEAEFLEIFEGLARDVGIPFVREGAIVVYVDVRLGDGTAATE